MLALLIGALFAVDLMSLAIRITSFSYKTYKFILLIVEDIKFTKIKRHNLHRLYKQERGRT